MKKILLSGVLLGILSVTAQADFEIGGIDFNKVPVQAKNLSVSNGGTIPDSEALSDGIGMSVMSAAYDTEKPDFKAMNQALLGAEEGEIIADTRQDIFITDKEQDSLVEDLIEDKYRIYGTEISDIDQTDNSLFLNRTESSYHDKVTSFIVPENITCNKMAISTGGWHDDSDYYTITVYKILPDGSKIILAEKTKSEESSTGNYYEINLDNNGYKSGDTVVIEAAAYRDHGTNNDAYIWFVKFFEKESI